MRPKFVLIIMVITLAFFLILMMSPGFWHRKALGSAVVARYQHPTPENVQAVELEKAKARREQYLVCSLAVLNVIAIIIYGAVQQRKGTI
jgi:hypothetical protein